VEEAPPRGDYYELNPPRSNPLDFLEVANRYAGVVVCSAAVMVVVLAFTSTAMVAQMHSRMSPDNVAAAAMHQMTTPSLAGAASGSVGSSSFGERLFLLGDPESSWWSRMAESMQINYTPLFSKIAAQLQASAEIFSDVAGDLSQEDSSVEQPDEITKMITQMMPMIAADIAAGFRTAASAVKMLSGLREPPSKDKEVQPEHFAAHQSLMSFVLGVNAMRDKDGTATFPFAIWLQKMIDPAEIRQLVNACVDSMNRTHSHMSMTVYTPVPMNPFTHQCLAPTSADGEEENPLSAIADAIASTTRKACSVDPKVSTMCICEEDKVFNDVSNTNKIMLDVCLKLQRSLSKTAPHP